MSLDLKRKFGWVRLTTKPNKTKVLNLTGRPFISINGQNIEMTSHCSARSAFAALLNVLAAIRESDHHYYFTDSKPWLIVVSLVTSLYSGLRESQGLS